MALPFGSVGAFDPSLEDWILYSERVDHYLEVNEVAPDSKKLSVFLSTCGPATYTLIGNLVLPASPSSKTYKEIIAIISNHYKPTPSVMAERLTCKFNRRIHHSGESVSTFVSELRQLSRYCDFGDRLSDMLRDRLVCGINDDRIQRRLLSEPELMFQKAFDLAQAMVADKGTHDLQNISQSLQSDVNILQQHHGQSLKKTSRSDAAHVQSPRHFCPAAGS